MKVSCANKSARNSHESSVESHSNSQEDSTVMVPKLSKSDLASYFNEGNECSIIHEENKNEKSLENNYVNYNLNDNTVGNASSPSKSNEEIERKFSPSKGCLNVIEEDPNLSPNSKNKLMERKKKKSSKGVLGSYNKTGFFKENIKRPRKKNSAAYKQSTHCLLPKADDGGSENTKSIKFVCDRTPKPEMYSELESPDISEYAKRGKSDEVKNTKYQIGNSTASNIHSKESSKDLDNLLLNSRGRSSLMNPMDKSTKSKGFQIQEKSAKGN